jgi:hypothetical protein
MGEKKPWDNASPGDWKRLGDQVIHRPPGSGNGGEGSRRTPQRGDSNYRAAMEIGTVVVVTLGVLILAELRRIRRGLGR